MSKDIVKHLQNQVKSCIEENQSLLIQGGNSKYFYGNNSPDSSTTSVLSTLEHNGIINYQASELVITARAGTRLAEIKSALDKNNQQLAFEPPHFTSATIGGMMASGLSGSSRPFYGSVRDAILGCKIINGHGEILKFGGEVVKNVAGYDASRLMTGALGTLGVLLEISVKVVPVKEQTITFKQEMSASNVIETMNEYRRSTLPISGLVFNENTLYTRLSSTKNSISAINKSMSAASFVEDIKFWKSINEQTHPFFNSQQNLWKILLPPASNPKFLLENSLVDWAGGLYWHYSHKPAHEIQALAKQYNGYAILFRRGEKSTSQENTFETSSSDMLSLQKNIKHAFDPKGIFNPGKMYSEI